MFKHISRRKLNVLSPNIPKNNWYIDNGIENNTIKRLCCSTTVDNCLTALGDLITEGDILYVYEFNSPNEQILSPKELYKHRYVPFVKHTNEYWVLDTVYVFTVRTIRVLNKHSSKIVREKHNGKYIMRELITWNWKYED